MTVSQYNAEVQRHNARVRQQQQTIDRAINDYRATVKRAVDAHNAEMRRLANTMRNC